MLRKQGANDARDWTRLTDLWHSTRKVLHKTSAGRWNAADDIPSPAGVVELVDAPDSKSGSERSVGSIPTARTTFKLPFQSLSGMALLGCEAGELC
jgi:hypothetical protein